MIHTKSVVTTYAEVAERQVSLKKKKKKSAARPGRSYFGDIFVINGEQSVVQNLILWFSTCKTSEPDVNLN